MMYPELMKRKSCSHCGNYKYTSMYDCGANCTTVFLQSHMHYVQLGDFKKREKSTIPPIPLEKVVYASITHEHT